MTRDPLEAPSRSASRASLTIVGGTYREICHDPLPPWHQLFGSGVRAAAAVGGHDVDVTLHTVVGAKERTDLETYAASYGFGLSAHGADATLAFTYEHAMAPPRIAPPLHERPPGIALDVRGNAILRFGMLDANVVVHGTRVVYDPQSAFRPVHFEEGGSTAGTLALIANMREAERLAERPAGSPSTVPTLVEALLRRGAAVVVLKRGARGVTVATDPDPRTHAVIPAFRTDRVFPIGSGDVFSAVFAMAWAVHAASPVDAARAASRAVAAYVLSRILPVPRDLDAEATQQVVLGGPLIALRPDPEADRPVVYLAGPFFTVAQRWLVTQAREALLAQGMHVFSPFHDVGLGPAEEVVEQDLRALDQCTAVLALVDGGDPGTLFEVGYARRRDVPVVVLAEHEPAESLKMLVGSGCRIAPDLVTAIYWTAWAATGA